MATESLKKFAEELKLRREEKNITLQQIANRTKIDIKYLRAIEEANFEILPELYIRAFIKEYSQTIDYDPADVIKKFDLAKKGIIDSVVEKEENKTLTEPEKIADEKVAVTEQEKIDTKPEAAEPPGKSLKQRNLIFAAASIVVLFLLAYFIFLNEPDYIDGNVINQQSQVGDGPRYEIDSAEAVKENEAIKDDSLDLVLTTSGRVWCKVLKDNKEIFQNFIDANQVKSFRAFKEFRVVVGNAGFVKFKLENEDLNLQSKSGEIRNYIINLDTVRSYLLSVPSKNEKKSPAKN